MKTLKSFFALFFVVSFLIAAVPPQGSPPLKTIKLIFIHHSTGENWLMDDYGNLGRTLGENNYFVSDTNYGWGPDGIGDYTDIPNWTAWFASENTSRYMDALFNESGQNSEYMRTLADPSGENQIVLFKSCFPNSALEGSPNDPPGTYEELSVSGAKYVYNTILQYFATRPDKLFIAITAPPLSDSTYAANARAFNDWLVNDWLADYEGTNVAVFDFHAVLSGPNNRHRLVNGHVEHVTERGMNTLYYPSDDDHPNERGSQKGATPTWRLTRTPRCDSTSPAAARSPSRSMQEPRSMPSLQHPRPPCRWRSRAGRSARPVSSPATP